MMIVPLFVRTSKPSTSSTIRWKTRSSFRHDWESESMPVHQYQKEKASKSRRQRIYGWGLAAGGALGIREFLLPKAKNHPGPLWRTVVPSRLPFCEHHTAAKVACGYGFTLFATTSGDWRKVYGTGLNPCGQVGFHPRKSNSSKNKQWLIDPKPIHLPYKQPDSTKILDIACGRVHSAIITDKEGIFCMGNNAHGQCGRPIIENEDFSSTRTVRNVQGIEEKPVAVCCGYDHTLILTECGKVYGFGSSADGQLGCGGFDPRWEPKMVEGDLKDEKIVQVAGVCDTVLALSEKGEIFGWGNSEYQQLACVAPGVPQVASARHLPFRRHVGGKIRSVAAGGSACALTTENGEVFVWGFGILGQGPEVVAKSIPSQIPLTIFGATEIDKDVQVTKVVAGSMHFAAITNSGALYMWGKNRYGLLGLGHENDQYFPLKVNINGYVKDISCGPDHTMATTTSLF